jgi:hypothetical protein
MVWFISTKSQIWSIEFIVGLVIFIGALLIFYKYSVNLGTTQSDEIKELLIDAKTLSTFLVDKGLPGSWNTSDVILVGLTNGDYRLNESKLSNFSALSYATAKDLLSVRNDYYVFFEDKNSTQIAPAGVIGVGKPGVNKTNINQTENPDNLLKVFRFMRYNGTIIRMGILIW